MVRSTERASITRSRLDLQTPSPGAIPPATMAVIYGMAGRLRSRRPTSMAAQDCSTIVGGELIFSSDHGVEALVSCADIAVGVRA